MAATNVIVANPTTADITAAGVTAKAGKVAVFSLDSASATLNAQLLVEAGCVVASGHATTVIDSTTQLAEKGSRLLNSMVRAVESAGSDTHAQAGL